MANILVLSLGALSLLTAASSFAVAGAPATPPARHTDHDFVPPPPPLTSSSGTLAAIRANGRLDCAVVAPLEDWNGVDIHGDLSAFESEICRGLAAAVLGDADKVAIHAFPGEPETVLALRAGQVQVAIGLSPSTGVAVAHGVAFGRPVFFDTVRLLTHKDSGVHDAAGLKDRLVCAMDLSFAEVTVQDEMRARGIPLMLQSHSEQGGERRRRRSPALHRRCGHGVATGDVAREVPRIHAQLRIPARTLGPVTHGGRHAQ